MPVTTPCYCNRDDAQRAVDFADTVISNAQLDRAIQSAARNIEAHLHREFYPLDTVRKFDWPSWSYADPWRLWFGRWDLISATQVTAGGSVIPLGQIMLRPYNRKLGFPYTHLELDKSTSATFNQGATNQLNVAVTGTWGFTADTDQAATLTAAIVSTSALTAAISDGSQVGAGDLIVIDSERMLVAEKSFASTGVAFAGLTTDSSADNVLPVADGTVFHPGEVLLFDSERCLITDITGNNLILKRAWDGTVLSAHTSGTIWAARSLTVARGQLGTTAATHLSAAPVLKHRVPSLIRDLAVAEAVNRVLQETSGYARTVGGPDMAAPAPGVALADLWAEANAAYGRQVRIGAV